MWLLLTMSSIILPLTESFVILSPMLRFTMKYARPPKLGPFSEALKEVSKSIQHRFFFPGHGGKSIMNDMFNHSYDLPELDLLDSVHHPDNALQESLDAASTLFGSKRSWFLVNGSTSGILATILAVVKLHRRHYVSTNSPSSKSDIEQESVLLVGRDSHKSVFNAVNLANCDMVLLPTQIDTQFKVSIGIDIKYIEEAILTYGNKICGLVVTRPTYQGVMTSATQLTQIITLCHEYHIPVIIDEAHGSHIRFFNDPLFIDGMSAGADITIQSTHKTLPSLSQTGMMHLHSDAVSYIQPEYHIELEELLHETYCMLTTTSANALLLASLDMTVAYMTAYKDEIYSSILHRIDVFKSHIRQNATGILLLEDSTAISQLNYLVDPMKVSLQFLGQDSVSVDDLMCEEHGLYCELNLSDCLTYVIHPLVDENTLTTLETVLIQYGQPCVLHNNSKVGESTQQIYRDNHNDSDSTQQLVNRNGQFIDHKNYMYLRPHLNGPPMIGADREYYNTHNTITRIYSESQSGRDRLHIGSVLLHDAVGQVSAETICPYPPGIPIVVKGEVITTALIQLIELYQKDALIQIGSGRSITGAKDDTLTTIQIYNNNN